MTVTREQLEQMFNDDLAGQFPWELHICLKILDFISSEKKENLNHITFRKLFELSNGPSMPTVTSAAQYLTGDRAQLLDIAFEFCSKSLIYPLTIDEVCTARSAGEFKHPITGELVDDWEHKILIYFILGVNGLEVAL